MQIPTQTFTFDANAKSIRDFVLNGKADFNDVFRTDANFAYYVMLCPSDGTNSLYGISFFDLSICDVRDIYYREEGERWWWKEHAHFYVYRREVAYIALGQERINECAATLYIEEDSEEWTRGGDSSSVSARKIGTDFVVSVWRDVVQKWIARAGTLTEQPPQTALPRTPRRGRRPEYDSETMCLAVMEWRELQAQPRRASDLDFDDMLDDAPAKRMTKIEFLANKFNGGDVNNLAVSERKLDRWAEQFDKGAWEIPKEHKKRYEKLKSYKKEL